ncbi:hypothetical protein MPTK2_4g90460P [Marchantia polymorpha subsp. ruderalis]
MVFGTLLVLGAAAAGYYVYDKVKEQKAKENYAELISDANDQQDAETVRIKKRAILGRLVYGTYDRFRGAENYEEWWTNVHYRLVPLESVLSVDERNSYAEELQDELCNQYFGVFQRTNESLPSALAPNWVVAIRGTDLSNIEDIINDLRIFTETLHSSTLIPILEAVVRSLVAQHGYDNVNVTGHSLGAAAGLLVCRRLALEGCLVEGHFFNPPFTTLKSLLRVIPKEWRPMSEELCEDGKSLAMELLETDPDPYSKSKALAEFARLAKVNWSPYLYVNKYDVICNDFLSHFKKAKPGTCNYDEEKWYSSVTDLTQWVLGETESFHLFPFAHLNKIKKTKYGFRPVSAHKLWTWLNPRVAGQFKQARLIPRPHNLDGML